MSKRQAKMQRTGWRAHVAVSNEGPPCHTCRQPLEVREHAQITEKLLRQAVYYRRWYFCTNPRCKTETITPPEFRVFTGEARYELADPDLDQLNRNALERDP